MEMEPNFPKPAHPLPTQTARNQRYNVCLFFQQFSDLKPPNPHSCGRFHTAAPGPEPFTLRHLGLA